VISQKLLSKIFSLVLSHTYYKSDKIEEALNIENLTEMLKGSLEGCVLEIISRHETYGYEITRRLNELGFTEVVEGTVYTILVRLEKKKLVNIDKKPSDMGPPRKFYSLNEAGRQELELFWRKWAFLSSKINVLKSN
jgi:PadR family transcriptional regulator, regulatory protein PadR